jgi:hypothetical protein
MTWWKAFTALEAGWCTSYNYGLRINCLGVLLNKLTDDNMLHRQSIVNWFGASQRDVTCHRHHSALETRRDDDDTDDVDGGGRE